MNCMALREGSEGVKKAESKKLKVMENVAEAAGNGPT